MTVVFIVVFFALLANTNTVNATDYIFGYVKDKHGAPITEATVRMQTQSGATYTNSHGYFQLLRPQGDESEYVTAWKRGHFNGGVEYSENKNNFIILLEPLPEQDNKAYHWISSGREANKNYPEHAEPCQDCHPKIFNQWQHNGHSKAAANKLFLSHFDGPLLSYKTDFPTSNGNCATCHVPAMALNSPFNSDPAKAQSIEKQGIFCDFCHKVQSTQFDENGGRPGVLSMTLTRPENGKKLLFGPFDDVFPAKDSYSPIFEKSEYCATCHHGEFWGQLVYSEFDEWQNSRYADEGISCQDCHMKPDGVRQRFAPKEKGGRKRAPETIASHRLMGDDPQEFIRNAVILEEYSSLSDKHLTVSVAITNQGAGHSIPAGTPLKSLILLVEINDADHNSLEFLSGSVLPVWAGVATETVMQGRYAGLPGKQFAKIFRELIEYPNNRERGNKFLKLYPAPFWRPVSLDFDNRIAADATDVSQYLFSTEGVAYPLSLKVSLLYRPVFKSWQDAKNVRLDDIPLVTITRDINQHAE